MESNKYSNTAQATKLAPKNLSLLDLLLVNTSFFNILFPIAFILFIKKVPQASHIILSKLGDGDPISTTLFILLYTLFTGYIFYLQRSNYNDRSAFELSVVFDLLNRLSFFIPMTAWLIVLIRNNCNTHLKSIIISIIILGLIYKYLVRKNNGQAIIKYPVSYLIYLFVIAYILLAALHFQDLSSEIKVFQFILLILFLAILYFVFILIETKIVIQTRYEEISQDNFIWFGVVLLVLLTITICISPSFIFSPINILLLYVLSLRIIIYLLGKGILILTKDLEYDKTSKNIFHITIAKDNYLTKNKTKASYLITIFIVFYILGFITRKSSRAQHEIRLSEYKGNKQSIENYIKNWLLKDTTTAPIFLVTGQGGGSRAGLAFFHTISLLDSTLKDNLLSINTISGSSTGAQFYLSAKKTLGNNYFNTLNESRHLRIADSILYQRDYISSSLYKLLFSDYFRSRYSRRPDLRSRNYALVDQEIEAYISFDTTILRTKSKLGDTTGILNESICQFYNGAFTRDNKFPLFFPVSYNINYGLKTLSSPVSLPKQKMAPFYDILDTIGGAKSIKIIQAVALNQLFPIISAPAIIDSSYYLDGGVYDNQGFETLFDLYNITKSLRDSFAKCKPIILLSIENGTYELDGKVRVDTINSIKATMNAAVNSIFTTVPMVQKQMGIRSLAYIDTFFQLRVFKKDTNSNENWHWFKFTPRPDEVVMSRYVTRNELDTMSSVSSRVVDEVKMEMDGFLKRKEDTLQKLKNIACKK